MEIKLAVGELEIDKYDEWTDEEVIPNEIMNQVYQYIDEQIGKVSINHRKTINEVKKKILHKVYKQFPVMSMSEKNQMRKYLITRIRDFLYKTVNKNFEYDKEIVYTGVEYEGRIVYWSKKTSYLLSEKGVLIGIRDDDGVFYLF